MTAVEKCATTTPHPPHRTDRGAFGIRECPGVQAEVAGVDHAEQPMPIPNDRPSIQGLVRADLKAREQVGIQRYGTPLQAFNQRDALRDAYEEALDLACYLRQAIEERPGLLTVESDIPADELERLKARFQSAASGPAKWIPPTPPARWTPTPPTVTTAVARPGDTLIVGLPGRSTAEELEKIRAAYAEALPRVRVVVGHCNALQVYRPEAVEAGAR